MAGNHNERAIETDLASHEYAMTMQEIGDALGLNRQTVWTIYHRALRKLRRKNPRVLEQLRALSAELDRNRADGNHFVR